MLKRDSHGEYTPCEHVTVAGKIGGFVGEFTQSTRTDSCGEAEIEWHSDNDLAIIWANKERFDGNFRSGELYILRID